MPAHSAFDLFQQGNGYKRIAEHLNQMGYRSKKGRPLSNNIICLGFHIIAQVTNKEIAK